MVARWRGLGRCGGRASSATLPPVAEEQLALSAMQRHPTER